MRSKEKTFPRFKRVIRKFIWIPTTLKMQNNSDTTQRRWLEWAWVVQMPARYGIFGVPIVGQWGWIDVAWVSGPIDFEVLHEQRERDYEAGKCFLPPPIL